MKNIRRFVAIALLILFGINILVAIRTALGLGDEGTSGADFSVFPMVKRINSVGIVVLLSIFLILFWIVYSIWRRQTIKAAREQSQPSQSSNL